jgi:hypothetical protein
VAGVQGAVDLGQRLLYLVPTLHGIDKAGGNGRHGHGPQQVVRDDEKAAVETAVGKRCKLHGELS